MTLLIVASYMWQCHIDGTCGNKMMGKTLFDLKGVTLAQCQSFASTINNSNPKTLTNGDTTLIATCFSTEATK